jgi:hypothetical protein
MDVGTVYEDVSARLADYLEALGMRPVRGPLRVMGELVRGILWTGSVQLTNAARLRATSPARLARIVKQYSQHFASRKWDHRDWAAQILARQVRDLQAEDLLPLDGTELAKPYSRHLEHQCTVKDSSRPGKPLVQGYWVWGAYLWRPRDNSLRPLMLRPYSQKMPGFRSENDCWDRYAWTLRQATGGKGVWLYDRGGDRPEVLSSWLRSQEQWIIRLREDRPLLGPDGTRRSAGQWADWALSQRPQRGRAVTLPVRLPADEVRQLGPPPRLWLVVPTYVFGSGERWVLLTKGRIDRHVGPRQVRHEYAMRWRSEDAKRMLGQLWHVERFLTRSFLALERMLWCVVAAGGFLGELEEDEPHLADYLREMTLYWAKPAVIREYRMARGLVALAAQNGCAAVANNA